MDNLHVVIAYDIPDNQVRGMVADFLLAQGLQRIQRSVYEGELSKFELKEVKIEIKSIEHDIDLVIYTLCNTCKNKRFRYIQTLGTDDKVDEDDRKSKKEDTKEIKPVADFTIDLVSIKSDLGDSQIITYTIHEGRGRKIRRGVKSKRSEVIINTEEKRVVIID